MDKNLLLMDDLISGITQTDEWAAIERNDPFIQSAANALSEALETLRESVPREVVDELQRRADDQAFAYINAAMLYGIHVAIALLDASTRPGDLSRHIMQRMGRDERKN